MLNYNFLLVFLFTAMIANAQSSIYDFEVTTLEGDQFKLSDLKGKKVMIVNTASKCGLTGQYEQLESIYEKYKNDNFIIVGFPANNFMQQEPGTHEEIREFCTKNYGVTFPMMEKISVKGNDIHPIYRWLTKKELNGFEDSKVKWNFQKYLINEKGQLEVIIPPKTKPDAPQIISWITGVNQ
jgi:glutathione peroxidase